jgi:excisionase family DNA binding protein
MRTPLLAVDAVALTLNCSKQTVYRLADSGQLACHRIGRRVLFHEEDLDEFIRHCRRRCSSPSRSKP